MKWGASQLFLFSFFCSQCDQRAFIVFIICPFTAMKNCPIVPTKFTKVGNTYSQILNKPSQNCQRHFSSYQSGEISPNLVILSVALLALDDDDDEDGDLDSRLEKDMLILLSTDLNLW